MAGIASPRLLGEHLEQFVESQPKKNTAAIYEASIKLFLRWSSEVSLETVTPDSVEAWLNFLETENMTPRNTLSTRFWSVRAYFEYLVGKGLVDESPFAELTNKNAEPRPAMPILSRTELDSLIRTSRAASPTDEAAIALFALMGLTVTQACEVFIEEFEVVESGQLALQVIDRTGEIIKAAVPSAAQSSINRARGSRSGGALLLRRDGTPMSRRSADRIVKRIAKAAELDPKIGPESLRQSYIAHRIEDGVPVWTLADEARISHGMVRNHINRARRESQQ